MPKYLVSVEIRYEVEATDEAAAKTAVGIVSDPEIVLFNRGSDAKSALDVLGVGENITQRGSDFICVTEESEVSA